MRSKTTINWLFNDVLCYLFVAFFDWKIGFFQQTHVRVYDILKTGMANVLWAITLLFEYNSDYQILWIRFMYSFNTLSLFNKSLYSQCFHLDLSIYNIHLLLVRLAWFHQELEIFLVISNLDIDRCNLVRSDHPSNTKRGGFCIYYRNSLSNY